MQLIYYPCYDLVSSNPHVVGNVNLLSFSVEQNIYCYITYFYIQYPVVVPADIIFIETKNLYSPTLIMVRDGNNEQGVAYMVLDRFHYHA